jgi:nucleoside-diphosphate-sugar epimerase
MKVLIIGGNRFVGSLLAWRLCARGDEVTLLNRGNLPDPFGTRVERLRADRTSPEFTRALEGRRFDATVDFAAYEARDVRTLVDCVGERAGHYVFIGSGQVYLVREAVPVPSREGDYDGPLLARPDDPSELHEWEYGVKKRACEDVLVEAGKQGFRGTRIRLPMVNGERDYLRRIEGYLWRILDGGPVLLPDGGEERARHVYGLDAAQGVAQLLGDERTVGQAYNLCQEEIPSVFDVVGMLIERLGADDRRVTVARDRLGELPPSEVSPFSHRWMSCMDPSRARRELGFTHRPLGVYLSSIVSAFLAFTPAEPPPGYRHRSLELALARTLRL